MCDSDTAESQQLHSASNDEELRPPQPKNEFKEENKRGPKHLRLRYWSSWEEQKLVELWRRFSDEVVTLQKNTPVFRKISHSMKECGFQVNSQECRRKINSLKNKYISERRRFDIIGGTTESDWRLYHLIHCILVPKQKNPDLTHELKMVNQLLAKMPPLPPELMTAETKTLSTQKVAIPLRSTNIKRENGFSHRATVCTQEIQPPNSLCAPAERPKRHYTPRRTYVNSSASKIELGCMHPFTLSRLEQVRQDNRLQAEKRDMDLKRLRNEQQEYKCLEVFLNQLQMQQEQVLLRLQAGAGN